MRGGGGVVKKNWGGGYAGEVEEDKMRRGGGVAKKNLRGGMPQWVKKTKCGGGWRVKMGGGGHTKNLGGGGFSGKLCLLKGGGVQILNGIAHYG